MLNILFLLQKNRTNQKGTCPIRCRITYLKARKEFSTGLFIKPEHWQNTKQKAHPPNEENNFINTQLSLIQNKMNQAFLFLQLQQSEFNVVPLSSPLFLIVQGIHLGVPFFCRVLDKKDNKLKVNMP